MKRSIHLAVAATLLVLGAYAVAQTGARPPRPPTVVKPAGAGAPNTKIMSTPSSGAGKLNVNGAGAKAQGAGNLAPPPPGNAAIKGESAAIKGGAAGAIGGTGAINGGSMKADKTQGAIKSQSAIGGAGAINGGTMKADKASTGKLAPGNAAIKGESAAMKGAPAGALQSPAGR